MNIYKNLLSDFQKSYMLMIPLSIVLQSCLGSIAALYIVKEKGPFMLLQLAICIAVTMIFNASILAQLKTHIVFRLLVLSLFSNILLLITA